MKLRILAVAFTLVMSVISAKAVRELVEVEEPQLSQRVEGVVLDPTGVPIGGLTVTDRTEAWGRYCIPQQPIAKDIFGFLGNPVRPFYYLRFDHPLFNPLTLKLKLDKHAPQRVITASPHIGG